MEPQLFAMQNRVGMAAASLGRVEGAAAAAAAVLLLGATVGLVATLAASLGSALDVSLAEPSMAATTESMDTLMAVRGLYP